MCSGFFVAVFKIVSTNKIAFIILKYKSTDEEFAEFSLEV